MFGTSNYAQQETTINKRLTKILGIHDAADLNLSRIGGMIVIPMMLLTVADITLRYVFIHPISGTYEVMRLMLAGVVFLAFAYVQSQRSHIVITVVSDHLPLKVQETLSFVWIIMALCALVILAWQGTVVTVEAMQAGEVTLSGSAAIPTAPARGVLAFGYAVLSIRLFRQIVEGARRFMTGVK